MPAGPLCDGGTVGTQKPEGVRGIATLPVLLCLGAWHALLLMASADGCGYLEALRVSVNTGLVHRAAWPWLLLEIG